MRDDFDSPWKIILEQHFPEFMAFFFPKIHRQIDWSRGWESLDKEFEQIVRDAALGKRLADKLVKVWGRDGKAQVVYIHVEIQGRREKVFAKRMYIYNYRAFDRYQRPVVSLAVLADTSPGWRPERFRRARWGCEVRMRFPTVKLNDWRARWAELERSDNLFATVVMTHLKTQDTRAAPQSRLRWKMRLVRRLYERGFSRQEVIDLFRFIDWMLVLPEELKTRFQVQLERFEKETKMPYISSVEQMAMDRGHKKGVRKGVREGARKGVKKGVKKGRKAGMAILLRDQLAQRFGALPEWVEQRLKQASEDELKRCATRVLTANSAEEVFEGL